MRFVYILLTGLFFPAFLPAQSLRLFQVDTALNAIGAHNFYTAVSLNEDKLVHPFVHFKHEELASNTLGDITIKTYDTSGALLHIELSETDSLFIRKVIQTEEGGQLILGTAYQDVHLYGTDTFVPTYEYDVPGSFILHINSSHEAVQFISMAPTLDFAYDEGEQSVYFVEQVAHEWANVCRYDLATGTLDTLTTIGKARQNTRIVKTSDYIYICGASIVFGIDIGDIEIGSEFPYMTYVLQLGLDGSYHWINIIEDVTTPNMTMAEAPDQGVYFCSDLSMGLRLGEDSLLGPTWGGDFLLTRMDQDGHYEWATEVPNNTLCGFVLGYGYFMDTDAGHNIYIAGSSRALLEWDDGTVVGIDSNISVPTVLIYNPEGAVIHHKISEPNGVWAALHTIDVEADGSFAVSGLMTQTVTFEGVTKTIPSGTAYPFFLYYNHVVTGIDETPEVTQQVEVYPNPLQKGQQLTVTCAFRPGASIEIYNLLGQHMKTCPVRGPVNAVYLDDLLPGNYVLVVNDIQKKITIW